MIAVKCQKQKKGYRPALHTDKLERRARRPPLELLNWFLRMLGLYFAYSFIITYSEALTFYFFGFTGMLAVLPLKPVVLQE